MSNNILVTGSNGQLGSEFKNIESNYPEFNFHFRDRDLDISIKERLEDYIFNENINIILNTAAYTDVNSAEIEKEKADLVNTFAVKNLVKLTNFCDVRFLRFRGVD